MEKIISCVGNHDVQIYRGTSFDPSIRKYRGGYLAATIPFSGKMLSAKVTQEDCDAIHGVPTKSKQIFTGVDPLPSDDGDTYYIVSAMYVAACKEVGYPTDKLLTIGGTVVDDEGRVIGAAFLNRN